MYGLEKIKRWENVAEKLINSVIPNFSKNFDKVAINVTPNDMYGDYYVHCEFIMKKPFKKEEADFFYTLSDEIKNLVKNHLPPLDKKYSLSFGTMARELYDSNSKPYYDRKKETLDEQAIKILKVINSI